MFKRLLSIGALVAAITSGMLFTPSDADAQRWRGRVWVEPSVSASTYYYPSGYYSYYYDPNVTYTAPTYTAPTYTAPTYTAPTYQYSYPTYYYQNTWYPGYYMDRYPLRPRWW